MNTNRSPMESLEARQLMAATIKGTDVRTLVATDGTKNNGNDVVLKFSGPIKSVDATKFGMFGYANNTMLGGQRKVVINVKSATIDSANPNNVILRTDVMIRKGAQITLRDGAVTDNTNAGVTGVVRTTKGLNRDRFTLALRQFKVGDKSLFSSVNLTGGATATVANTEPSSASVTTALTSFLNKKVKAKSITQAQMDAAMTRFNSTAAKTLIPSANLRAAVISLVGTVGEPAIEFYLGTANSTKKTPVFVGFDGSQISSGATVVELSYTTSTKRLKVVFSPNYAGESFVVLSGRLAHEAMHDDTSANGGPTDSQDEEVIANFVESAVYAQQVVTDFTYSRPKTQYTLHSNYRLYLLLNSGDRQFPRVGVKEAPLKNSGGAAPGFDTTYSTPGVVSFEKDVRNEMSNRSIGDKLPLMTTATGRAILTKMTGDTYSSTTTYHDALIDQVDISQDVISDAFAMKAARVLQVKIF